MSVAESFSRPGSRSLAAIIELTFLSVKMWERRNQEVWLPRLALEKQRNLEGGWCKWPSMPRSFLFPKCPYSKHQHSPSFTQGLSPVAKTLCLCDRDHVGAGPSQCLSVACINHPSGQNSRCHKEVWSLLPSVGFLLLFFFLWCWMFLKVHSFERERSSIY